MKKWHGVIPVCLMAVVVGWGYVQAQPRMMVPPSPYSNAYAPQYSEVAPVPGQLPLDHEAYYLSDVPLEQPLQAYEVGAPIELYGRVIYRDTRKIHPAAVPYLVQVPLFQPRRAGCVTCPPCCVWVKICVPPCSEPCVKVRRNGHLLCYDFGRHSVKVVVRRDNRVIVNYGH